MNDSNQMAMLANENHPGTRCSCRECLITYPDAVLVAGTQVPHTPGPWVSSEFYQCRYTITRGFTIKNENGYLVAVVSDLNEYGQNKANARLISAAPELLNELKYAHEIILAMLPHMSAEACQIAGAKLDAKGINSEGLTRHHERAEVLAKAEGR